MIRPGFTSNLSRFMSSAQGLTDQYAGKLNKTGWRAVSPWRIIPKEDR